MKLTKWSIVAAWYVVWNTCAYSASSLFGVGTILYDYSYWICERVFVPLALWAIMDAVEKKYRWIIKAFMLVAAWKLVYLLLVILKVIEKNDFQSLMGVLFTLILGVVIFRWEKLSKRS